jgi:hypothetical protein
VAKKLVTEYNFDFLVWGIISPWPAYRIVWLMNERMHLGFKRIEDIEVRKDAGGSSHFPLYEYENKQDMYLLELVQNRIPNDLFVPELKTVDYLLLIKGELDFFDSTTFLRDLKQQDGIHNVLEIGMEKLRSKENLIFR